MARSASIKRNTLETQITVSIDLDGSGASRMETGVPFLEHMLDQIARHGLIDLDIVAKGDLHIDAHHTVEDLGITLGQAFAKAIGDKKGIRRYGHAYVPLDEALSRVVLDLSGRPGLVFDVDFHHCPPIAHPPKPISETCGPWTESCRNCIDTWPKNGREAFVKLCGLVNHFGRGLVKLPVFPG